MSEQIVCAYFVNSGYRCTSDKVQSGYCNMSFKQQSHCQGFELASESVEQDSATAPAVDAFNQSGSKYLREMSCLVNGKADVYAVLEAFKVTCPARQHAITKLLCAGLRGKAGATQDLGEARDAVDRAMQMQVARK